MSWKMANVDISRHGDFFFYSWHVPFLRPSICVRSVSWLFCISIVPFRKHQFVYIFIILKSFRNNNRMIKIEKVIPLFPPWFLIGIEIAKDGFLHHSHKEIQRLCRHTQVSHTNQMWLDCTSVTIAISINVFTFTHRRSYKCEGTILKPSILAFVWWERGWAGNI